MDALLREFVRERANDRCEYCHLPQEASPFLTFHIEHVLAQQHILDDGPGNLALACPDCNRHKGPNLATLDSDTRQVVRLFDPRKDEWESLFIWEGAVLVGQSREGQATVRLLQINSEERIEMRAALMESGLM